MTDPIERTPDVCGGSARIAGTRVPVWVIEGYHELGAGRIELSAAFDLSIAQVDAALKYAHEHPEEIAAEIASNEDP